VVDGFQKYDANLQRLEGLNGETRDILCAFKDSLKTSQQVIEDSLGFIGKCSRACKLDTAEKMMGYFMCRSFP